MKKAISGKWSGEQVALNGRIPEDQKEALDKATAARKIFIQDALSEAIDLWLDPSADRPLSRLTKKHEQLVRRIIERLERPDNAHVTKLVEAVVGYFDKEDELKGSVPPSRK